MRYFKNGLGITLLPVILSLSACGGEKVDISEYIIPTQYHGNVREVLGSLSLNPELINDAVQIREYSKNKIEADTYNVASDKMVSDYKLANRMLHVKNSVTQYKINKDTIFVASNANTTTSSSYSLLRLIQVNKDYKNSDTGTFEEASNANNDNIDTTDKFKLTKLDGKDCLIHTRIYNYKLFSKEHSFAKYEYAYCKPYGLVHANVYERDGSHTELLNLRRAEEI